MNAAATIPELMRTLGLQARCAAVGMARATAAQKALALRALARLLRRVETDSDFLKTLRRQCAERRKLISRSLERKKLRSIITECLRNIK